MSNTDKRKRRRGRRKKAKEKKSGILYNIVLIVAAIVFCVAAVQLFIYAKGYLDGRNEYKNVRNLAITSGKPEGGFRVDFDSLMAVNEDTVGWLRFYPEPEIINYPVVQGADNKEYLKRTFSANENTMGAIFMDAYNTADFTDRNTIIYGHRMQDGSMFRKLDDYKEKSFWENNPRFYIYTPDGRELTYDICSVGVVTSTSITYQTEFETDEEFQQCLDAIQEAAEYDTGITLKPDSRIVTLSTCTRANNRQRFVVWGVLEKEVQLKGE